MPIKTKAKPIKRQRPQKKLREVIAEAKGPGKGKLIDKRFTAMKAVGSGNDGVNSGLFEPTSEDMAAINQFTLRPVSADEVACFNTFSCNDMLDRDDDRFTKDCVDDFAKLDGPLSSVGKSYMVGHDYSKLPVGRIFGVGTTDVESVHFLTNKVYVPRIPETESFLANQEFGVYWAVSVGVMLEDSECSVCQSPMIGNYWVFCMENGHEKGLYYDPNSEEKDSWGWAEPVDPDSKGAVKCTRELSSPSDFYELSQVFLGAQYDAQIGSKSAAMKGILKAASAAKVPILNLSYKEAVELPMQHVSEEVREAYAKGYEVKTEDDGSTTWTDDDNMVWAFDPEESEVVSLGEKSADDDEGGEADGEEDGRQSEESVDEDPSGSDDPVGDEGELGQQGSADGEGDDDATDADEEGLEDDSDDDEDEEEDEVEPVKSVVLSSDTVLAACKKANLPEDVIKALSTKGNIALDKLLVACSRHIKSLESRAALGDSFVEAKRVEALKWYVKAQQSGGDKRVKVDTFKRILAALGDDVDLIDDVIEENRSIAQKKFPASVRRSSAAQVSETGEIEVDPPGDLPSQRKTDERTTTKVRSLHG